MYDFEDVNRILAELAMNESVEPMVEPIDEPTCHPLDFAEVTGLFDEMYPEPEVQEMFDENGVLWYVYGT